MMAALVLALSSQGASAHSQTPGYKKIATPGDHMDVTYELKNEFDFPIILRIDVLEKDGSIADESSWETQRRYFKMRPGSEKSVTARIFMGNSNERKVMVCSVLDKVGYEETNPTTITRVCSRLWLWR